MNAPIPHNEAERLTALQRYNLLDTPPEEVFDDLTLLAAHLCDAPIAMISLVDANRQWFKARVGWTIAETSRDISFCAHAILQPDELFIVPDALVDERFAANPLVISDPNIRFYAAAPLVTDNGYALGTLCVLDHIPRQLTPQQVTALQTLRRAVINEIQLRHNLDKHKQVEQELQEHIQQLNLAHEQAIIYAKALNEEIVERRQAEEQFRQNAARAEALTHVAARLNQQLDLKTVLNTISEELAQVLNTPAAAVRLFDPQQDALYYANTFGLPPNYLEQASVSSRALYEELIQQHGPLIVVPDVQAVPRAPNSKLYTRLNIRTVLTAIMLRSGELVGALNVFTFGEVRHFSENELALLKGLADQAAQAIANARLFEAAQQELAERKRAEQALEEERALLTRRVAARTTELSAANAELARTARAKDEFLASMSHELRTPLHAILGLTEALQEQTRGPLNERQLKSLRTVEESGRHLLALINDILDISKIEAGKLELQLDQVSIEAVCQTSLLFIRETAAKKKIQVLFTLDNSVSNIQADARRLKQILVNLLTNAVKFTPPAGQVGLEVRGEPAQEAVHFIVWDTGSGISPDDMGRLFQPFVQLDSSLSRQHEGTGLGLALVSRLAELHGGSILVESQVGQGSRFTVSLPWSSEVRPGETIEPPGLDPEISPLPASLPPPELPLILLAEDNEANIELMANYLEDEGYRLVTARNGAEAIERVNEEPPALILMDIQMPGMDGLTAIRRIRADNRLAHIPIIALTALAMPDDRDRCLAAGANDYLSKPVGLKKLNTAIKSYLAAAKVNNQ